MTAHVLTETGMGSLRAFLEDAGTHRGRLITITTEDARAIGERLNAVEAPQDPPEWDALRKALGADMMDRTLNDLIIRAQELCRRAEKAERERDDLRDWKNIATERGECVHCGNEGCGLDHWTACEKHPAGLEIDKLRAALSSEQAHVAGLQSRLKKSEDACRGLKIALAALDGGVR